MITSEVVEVVRATRLAYSAYAESYALATRDFQRYPGLYDELHAALEILPPGRILDVGCGSGRDAALALDMGRLVIPTDISLAMINQLQAPLLRRSVCCDVLRLPFISSCFAGVIASGVLLHLPKVYCAEALSEVARVLLPSGAAIISMKRGTFEGWRKSDDFPSARWFSHFEPSEFARLCEAIGLTVWRLDLNDRKDWFTVLAGPRRLGARGAP
jgi:tRNA (uracil-5-)-methyltransferase TRM9